MKKLDDSSGVYPVSILAYPLDNCVVKMSLVGYHQHMFNL